MTHPLIHYRAYYSGPKDTGGMTALYPTEAEALRMAKACAFQEDDRFWCNAVYIGPLDALLLAVEPLEYTDWRGRPERKRVEAGETFRPGDVMIADHQVTHDRIGAWLEEGKVRSFPIAERSEP